MCERAKEMYHSHQTNTHTHTCKRSRLICLNQSDRTNDRAHWVCAWKRHSLGVYSHFDIDVYGVVESWCCSIHKCTSYTHSHSYSHISPPVYTINFACESTTCVNVCVCCTYQTNLQRRVVFFDIPYAQSEWVRMKDFMPTVRLRCTSNSSTLCCLAHILPFVRSFVRSIWSKQWN